MRLYRTCTVEPDLIATNSIPLLLEFAIGIMLVIPYIGVVFSFIG